MTLKEIETKLAKTTDIMGLLPYNFDVMAYQAEDVYRTFGKAINCAGEDVSEEKIVSKQKDMARYLVNFDKLTDEEQRYLTIIDLVRGYVCCRLYGPGSALR